MDRSLEAAVCCALAGVAAGATAVADNGGRTGRTDKPQTQLLRPAKAPPEVSLPAVFTTFPGEIWRTPRSWVEKSYLTYFNEVERGGHFAAWEEPELFLSELREAFRSLR